LCVTATVGAVIYSNILTTEEIELDSWAREL